MDLAREVSTASAYEWNIGTWQLGAGASENTALPYHVVAMDFGVKRNILRMLVDRGCRVTVVNAQTAASEILAMKPDGVFFQ